MNSLCPSAISHFYSPCGNYQWLDNPSTPDFPNIDTVEENGPQRWFFKIYGEIPLELHDSVNDFFVFFCISRPVPRDCLSPYNLSLVENTGMHWRPSETKLIAELELKRNIVVHHVLLRWMLVKGFNVTKVHRALQFDQKPYIKTFVDTFVNKLSSKNTGQKRDL
jgi:hypothetical protein